MKFNKPLDILLHLKSLSYLKDITSEVSCILSVDEHIPDSYIKRTELLSEILPAYLRPTDVYNGKFDVQHRSIASKYFLKYYLQELVKRSTGQSYADITEACVDAMTRLQRMLEVRRSDEFKWLLEQKKEVSTSDDEDENKPKGVRITNLKELLDEIKQQIESGSDKQTIVQLLMSKGLTNTTAQTYYYDTKSRIKRERAEASLREAAKV